MRRKIPTALLCLALAACGGLSRLPVCDGRDRRPANPNGSVLTAALAAFAPDPSLAPCGGRR